MEEKLRTISPLINQMSLRNLGIYSSSYLANDIYYLIETINLLLPDIGEDFISKKYKEQGKDWEKTKKNLDKLNKLVIKVKIHYDAIEDKKFSKIAKKDPERILQRFFIKTASKIALAQRELYDLFVFLVKLSTIQRQQIPSEAFKILEHIGFKKIDLTKKPIGASPPDEVIGESGQ